MTKRKLKKIQKKDGTFKSSEKPYLGYAYSKRIRKRAKIHKKV